MNKWLAALALVTSVNQCYGSRFVGNLTVRGDWQVVAQFVFSEWGGQVDGVIFVPHASTLVLYDDSDESWSKLSGKRTATCSEATSLVGQGGFARRVEQLQGNQENRVSFHVEGNPQRPSSWKFAIARCSSSLGRVLEQDPTHSRSLTMYHPSVSTRYSKYHSARFHRYHGHRYHSLGQTQSEALRVGDIWLDLHVLRSNQDKSFSEFPADEMLLLPGTIWFFLVFAGLCAFLAFDLRGWRSKQSGSDAFMTSLLVFYAISAICAVEATALFFSLLELVSYASRGVERVDSISLLRLMSALMEEVSRLSSVILLALLGTGWMIVSPKLQDAECLAQFGWALFVFYLLATLGTFLLSSGSNFTDEYHGALWIFVLVSESIILLFGLGYAVHTLCFSPKLKVPTRRHGAVTDNNIIQTQLRFKTLSSVAALIGFVFLQDWLLAILSSSIADWAHVDWVFLVSTTCHFAICAVLAMLFRPFRLQALQRTRNAVNDVMAWKAKEYGEDEDDGDLDFDGVQPFLEPL